MRSSGLQMHRAAPLPSPCAPRHSPSSPTPPQPSLTLPTLTRGPPSPAHFLFTNRAHFAGQALSGPQPWAPEDSNHAYPLPPPRSPDPGSLWGCAAGVLWGVLLGVAGTIASQRLWPHGAMAPGPALLWEDVGHETEGWGEGWGHG